MNQEPQKTQQELDAEMLQEYQSQQQNPAYVSSPQPEPATPTLANNDAITLLIMGIVSIALFDIVPPASIILGFLGIKKAKEYTEQGLELSGKAKIGALLAKIGFWVGIAATAFVIVVAILSIGSALLQIIIEGVANSLFSHL